jgi:hypothetical protein
MMIADASSFCFPTRTGNSEEAKEHSANVLREHGIDPEEGPPSGRRSRRASASASPEPRRASRDTSREGSQERQKDQSNIARGLKAYVVDHGFKGTIDEIELR